MADLIERLDAARRQCDVLDHPFYVRWERGELTRDELALYAGQYRHAVVALADAAATASPLAGSSHAAEEAAHVALWDEFAAAVGADMTHDALPETERCVETWTAASDPLEALAVLYAVEAGQPEVSTTKLSGLEKHYGFEHGSHGTAYFELHASRDREHAAHSRKLLEQHAIPADTERLVERAEAALAGNWSLLDGVSREVNP
jgi:pyrroloquinoline-quinone synthase